MPKPIPPPPPLPTIEETQIGLLFLRKVAVVGFAVFLLCTLLYRQDSVLVEYGRDNSIAWTVWKAETFDEKVYRTENDYKMVWLVGSSILRESFDEEKLNQELEAAEVPVRVAKFGMDRGAAGLSFALLRKLPIRKGDIVLHGVSPANFRKNWLSEVQIPSYRLMHLYSSEDFWDIPEWSLADKLEQSVAFPFSYWRFHDDMTLGITEVWYALLQYRKPKKSKGGYFLTYHTFKKKNEGKIKYGKENYDHFPSEQNDFSEHQLNMAGLSKMKEIVNRKEAKLVLVDIEPSGAYLDDVLNPLLRDTWQTWKKQNKVLRIPSMPITHYYDLKHPNRIGRKKTSYHLFQWISDEQF